MLSLSYPRTAATILFDRSRRSRRSLESLCGHDILQRALAIIVVCKGSVTTLLSLIQRWPVCLSLLDVSRYTERNLRQVTFDGRGRAPFTGSISSACNGKLATRCERPGPLCYMLREGDLLGPNMALCGLWCSADIVCLYQWSWTTQIAAAQNVTRLNKPDAVVRQQGRY